MIACAPASVLQFGSRISNVTPSGSSASREAGGPAFGQVEAHGHGHVGDPLAGEGRVVRGRASGRRCPLRERGAGAQGATAAAMHALS